MMLIAPVEYMHGGMSLEVIGETEVEVAYLADLWKQLGLDRGNGRSNTKNGSTGFYMKKARK
jgi:hypothetical protein